MKIYSIYFKRVIGFLITFILLIVIWPILLFIIIWLHFANRGAGAFFFQERPGKNGKIFKVIKFKTMTDERDANGELLPDEQRLTKVGKFVRSTSIDELPQLINVLKGDMSLIGPRPLLPQYLPLYSKEQARRHDVRPGITGWAQVNGRNLLKLSEKFECDVWYVKNCSFFLDAKIIILTMKNILMKKDIGYGAQNMHEIDDLYFAERIRNTSIKVGDYLFLRKPELDDVDDLLRLKNNRKASILLGNITPNYSKNDIVAWIKYHRNNVNERLYVIYDSSLNRLIGHVGLYEIDLNISKAEFGILIADDNCRGRGYGDICLKHMIKIGFEKLQLNKIELSFLKGNLPAEKLYLKNGFKIEGILKQGQCKNNCYYDVVLMALFNPSKM